MDKAPCIPRTPPRNMQMISVELPDGSNWEYSAPECGDIVHLVPTYRKLSELGRRAEVSQDVCDASNRRPRWGGRMHLKYTPTTATRPEHEPFCL